MLRTPLQPRALRPAILILALAICAACAPRRLAVRPVQYDVDVRLDPQDHSLSGNASVELERIEEGKPSRRGAVELKLHPDLAVESIEAEGATLRRQERRPGPATDETEVAATIHRLVVEDAGKSMRFTVRYGGRLQQDVAGGEREGEVHNFAVSAHVGDEGIYLGEGGYWYPTVEVPAGSDAGLRLAGYRLATDPVEGFELVAGLERDASDDGRLHWSSPFPLEAMVLLGGPLGRWSRQHGDVELHAVLDPSKDAVAQDILDASAEYLDRYQALIGPYPFREFTVLEAFFSSGFAFPTCTQIAGSQLSERKQYRRHGYLDHELLHNWWGNGVLLDPESGNWCEALASYMGNYYGYVLEGDEAGARKQRRNQSNFLSSLEPDEDKPLSTFGLEGGAARRVGYMKGAAVFHMLERELGAEVLFAGLRLLAEERMGQVTRWEHIRDALERAAGRDLSLFFEQWIERSGAPLLELTAAEPRPEADGLQVTISQGGGDFVLQVPLRLYYGERSEDVLLTVDRPVTEAVLDCELEGLEAVELDPDYHVFRKLKPEETMPTSSLPRQASRLLVVLPDGELGPGYDTVLESYRRSVLGEEDDPHAGHEVVVRQAGELDVPGDLQGGSMLVLGEAARHPAVQELLARTRSPIRWVETGFRVGEEDYPGAGHAVLMTTHHPDRPTEGITVYYGNDEAALANARLLSYYANSLLVFETPLEEDGSPVAGGPSGMPSTRVVRREDFEFHDRIEF